MLNLSHAHSELDGLKAVVEAGELEVCLGPGWNDPCFSRGLFQESWGELANEEVFPCFRSGESAGNYFRSTQVPQGSTKIPHKPTLSKSLFLVTTGLQRPSLRVQKQPVEQPAVGESWKVFHLGKFTSAPWCLHGLGLFIARCNLASWKSWARLGDGRDWWPARIQSSYFFLPGFPAWQSCLKTLLRVHNPRRAYQKDAEISKALQEHSKSKAKPD